MVLKNGVINVQAAGYNGAHTVYEILENQQRELFRKVRGEKNGVHAHGDEVSRASHTKIATFY